MTYCQFFEILLAKLFDLKTILEKTIDEKKQGNALSLKKSKSMAQKNFT